ncbi:ESSS subunit of NADH:ubiquinone oxidoreductase [Helicostylum pulchrum]|uniref:NADH dehydrogenase [ubiquinone] 1 beta subcomplex subunit 11, mitochondrial n=1 Tax=Helicostylum pulchrum TaxID=562976 RepID=A0ABP9XTY1_9FUNG|nr:ESSS subunit of NADH:ubiquinone oxidoreductase [Helicostylum pulchrum]
MISKIIARSTRLARPTNVLRRGGHGTPSYNEPGGYLFSEKVRVKEDWENIYYFGMGGGFLAMAVALYYKPDTSVVSWAKKEAEKSLKEKGITLEFTKTA